MGHCLSFLSFFTIILSVLQFTDSDYSFGIFKLFLQIMFICNECDILQTRDTSFLLYPQCIR